MEIRYDKGAKKFIEAQDRPTKQRIRAGIVGLTQKPPVGDIKTMQGYSDKRQRLQLAFELIKKLVLAWDPDYTKVTPQEEAALQEAERNFENGEYYTDSDIDWD